jgi:hypothetical protein
MAVAAAKALCKLNSESCEVDNDDNWKLYSETFMEDARTALDAAGAPGLLAALNDLLSAVQSVIGTFGVIRGDTPEDADIHTHDDWAEKLLKERADAACDVVAKAEGLK